MMLCMCIVCLLVHACVFCFIGFVVVVLCVCVFPFVCVRCMFDCFLFGGCRFCFVGVCLGLLMVCVVYVCVCLFALL